MSHDSLAALIDAAFERRTEFTPKNAPSDLREAVEQAFELLDSGKARVAEKINGAWQVNQWLKKAVLLSFRINDNQVINAGGFTQYFDKLPSKYANYDEARFRAEGVRVVPTAFVRKGAYVAPNVVLMPCYVNVGAYIDSGTMIDTWATVASCAQVGKNVHLSGGAGLGGVLEPLQANPTIIEDNVFIGARAEVAEGVIVEAGAVLSMGVYITASTEIYDRERDESYYGRVPAGSVVVSGSRPGKNGKYGKYSAVIMKRVDAQTRSKLTLNELLRNVD